MAGKVKKKVGENLSEANVSHVIELLEQEKPITKKDAYGILNIAQNSARLTKIIKEHKDKLAFRKDMKKKFRGKELTNSDIGYLVKAYLEGESLKNISNSSFRSEAVIKKTLEENNVPLRDSSSDYLHPVLLPEDGIKEDYLAGDLVFSARYNTVAIIRKFIEDSLEHGKVYGITLLGNNQQNAYQPYYELSDLTKIQHNLGTLFDL